MYTIYTDGSCLKNPGGEGGWGVVVITEDIEYHLSGGEDITTNNRMEMKAVIEGLNFLTTINETNNQCIIYSDSKLVINCATGVWRRNKNLDLWQEYDKASYGKKIEFRWIKGHSGDIYNELVDKLAKKEAIEIRNRNNRSK